MFKGPLPHYRRERWNTPDGDFVDLDWLASDAAPGRPLVVLFHGLEGSSHSHYARSLMRTVAALGWRGVVPHFRGCSGEANRLARAYHSGDSAEIGWLLSRLSERAAGAPLFAAGVSLGGNALLKWLGEQGSQAGTIVQAAAAICPPLDLALCGRALERGFCRLYTWHFLRDLKRKALAKLEHFPGLFDPAHMRAARTLWEFDELYTGPVHGYAGADDYWARASSRPLLGEIHIPTLLLLSADDPFVPLAAHPAPRQLSAAVRYECTRGGGHVGFMSRPSRLGGWLPRRILQHFADTQD